MNMKLLGPRVQRLILVRMFENRWRGENFGEVKVPVTREAHEKTTTEAWGRLKGVPVDRGHPINCEIAGAIYEIRS